MNFNTVFALETNKTDFLYATSAKTGVGKENNVVAKWNIFVVNL